MTKYSEEANRLWPYLLKRVERASVRRANGNGGGGTVPAVPAISFFDLTDVDPAGWDNGEVPTWDSASSLFKPTLPGGGGGITYVAGDGIEIAGTLISAKENASRGIVIDSTGIGVFANPTIGGLLADVDGLYIHRKTHSGLMVDSGGIGVGAGDGILVSGTLVRVNADDLLGQGIENDGANNFKVKLATSEPSALNFGTNGGLLVALDAPSGLVKGVDGLAMGLPSDVSATSTNSTTTSSHSHNADSAYDVTTSLTTKLLHANSGDLRLKTLDLNGNLDFVGADRTITADESLHLEPDVDLWLNPGGMVMYPDGEQSRTYNFQDSVTGILGFQLADWSAIEYPPGLLGANTMGLKLTYLKVDNLFARKFTADEVRVQRGEWFLTRSFGIVETDAVVPEIGSTVDIWFEEAAGLEAGKLFLPNNWIQFRTIDLASGLIIQTIFFQVVDAGPNDYVQRLPQEGEKVARQQWRLRRRSGGFTGQKIKKGEVGADVGQPRHEEVPGSGIWIPDQGVIYATSLFDADGPFIQTQVFDHVGNDAGGNPFIPVFAFRTRMGNLKSTVDYLGEIYGFAAGDDLSKVPSGGFRGIAIDAVYGARLFNTDVHLYEGTILSAALTRDMGLALRNDTTPFATEVRTIAYYDDLQVDEGTKLMTVGNPTAKIGSWGDADDRRLQLTSYGADWAAVFMQAVGDNGADDATVSVTAGGWYGKLGGVIQLNAHYVSHVTGDDTPRFRIGGDAGSFAKSNLHVYAQDFVNDDTVGIKVEAAGGSDAMMHWELSGSQQFVAGIDRTDGSFKIEPGNHLGTGTPAISINPTTGVVTINGLQGNGTGNLNATGGDGIDLVGTDIRVDATVVRTSRTITPAANDPGLTGGGNLSGNLTFAVDSSVVRTSRLITTAGALRGGRNLADTVPLTLALAAPYSGLNQTDGLAINDSLAGDGLVMSATKILSVAADVVRDNVAIVAGNGLTGGGQLSAGTITLNAVGGYGIIVGINDISVDPAVIGGGAGGNVVAGLGLSGGGDLATTGTVTLNVAVGPDLDVATDAILVKSTIARSATRVDSGFGLLGGGDLSADRTLSVDSAVVALAATEIQTPAGSGLTGGGSLAATRQLGLDFLVVVPATRQVIAGLGLTGGGTLAADLTLNVGAGNGILIAADSVAVNTAYAFNWTGAHSWNQAIAVSGGLNFMAASRQITTELAGHYLALRPKGDLLVEPAAGYAVVLPTGTEVRSTSPGDSVAGITGHRLWWPTANGAQLTIGGLKSDNMYTRYFTADEVRIHRGEQMWGKGYGILESDATTAGQFNNFTVYFEDPNYVVTSQVNGQIFEVGDRVQARFINWSTGLTVALVWFSVTSFTGFDAPNKRQYYRFQQMNATVPAGTIIPKGTVFVNFGVVGQGMIHLNALTEGDGPWIQFGKMTALGTSAPTFQQHVRIGKLTGTVDYATLNRWGIVAGNNIGTTPTAGFSGFAADDTDGMRLFNTAFVLYNAGASVLLVEKTNGISIKYGSSAFNSIGWYEALGTAAAPNPQQLRVQLNPRKVSPNWSAFDITSYGRAEDAYTRGVIKVTGQNSAGAAYNVWVDDGGVYFGSGTANQSQTGGFITNATTYFAGNVGINMTSPSYPLHVRQDTNASARMAMENTTVGTAAQAQVTVFADVAVGNLQALSSGWTPASGLYAGDVAVSATAGPLVLRTSAAHPIRFVTAGAEEMRILADGKIGIQTTAPLKALHVGPGATAPILSYDGLYVNMGSNSQITAAYSNGAQGGVFAFSNGNIYMGSWSDHPLILRTNNLDRVTINPAASYSIDSNLDLRVQGIVRAKNTGTVGSVQLTSGSATLAGHISWYRPHTDGAASPTRSAYMGWHATGIDLVLENSADLYIRGGGVRIGSGVAPAQTLSVTGDAAFSGLLTANAGITFGQQTLASYREGTWTPVLQGTTSNPTSINYSRQWGNYTRVGNIVHFQCSIQFTGKTGGAGTAYITLPFTAIGTFHQWVSGTYEPSSGAYPAGFYIAWSTNRAQVTSSQSNVYLGITSVAADATISLSGSYYVT